MDAETFIEMIEKMRHTDRRWESVTLVGPDGMGKLKYIRGLKEYVLHIYITPDDVYKGLYCVFVRAESEGPWRVRLITERSDGVDMILFDPTRFEIDERESSRVTIKESSTTVEQKEEATNGRR